jgi:DNA mismatch repair protein MutS2
MTVFVTTIRQKGEVLAVNDTEATIQLGALKLTVAKSACRLSSESGKSKEQSVTKHISISRTDSVARQIDIRGMNIEEAEIILSKYIDDAVLSGLTEILIIHGKGTGALRKGVQSYLANHSHIKSIRIADLNEGGTGATAAKLV